MNPASEIREDLLPILNVFGGADGGGAFAKLQHGFLTEIYSKDNPSDAELKLITMVKQFSKLCSLMLESK